MTEREMCQKRRFPAWREKGNAEKCVVKFAKNGHLMADATICASRLAPIARTKLTRLASETRPGVLGATSPPVITRTNKTVRNRIEIEIGIGGNWGVPPLR